MVAVAGTPAVFINTGRHPLSLLAKVTDVPWVPRVVVTATPVVGIGVNVTEADNF